MNRGKSILGIIESMSREEDLMDTVWYGFLAAGDSAGDYIGGYVNNGKIEFAR